LETNNDYNFSLFKPKSEYNRRVRNIIVSTLIIWAVAVFGFQILLLIFQKPTPEKAYITFGSVWEKVKTGSATVDEKKDFIACISAVLGKSTLRKEKKEILVNALSWSIYSALDSTGKEALLKNVRDFKSSSETLGKSITDEGYLQAKESLDKSKKEILTRITSIYGLAPGSLEANIIVFNLSKTVIQQLSDDDITSLPAIMKLYLVHNQSFLTDKKFLGFPFHYFYTAEFLLILFVLLCLFYSIRIEHLQKKYKIVE
jgi:putative solute:sodium symporter small subunit